MNAKLILTLLNIPNVSKKTINLLLKTTNISKISYLDSPAIIDAFINCRINNKKIYVPNIENLKLAQEKAEKILCESSNAKINHITILDNNFPQKLKEINDAPVILFFKGNKECILEDKSIAIIGTRNPTPHGQKIAERLGYLFGSENFIVVSGLAKGCDELGHKGCVTAKGKSIAVLPGGLDKIYPASNKHLAQLILDNDGCLVSEYPIGVRPFKSNFIERDRLQSALSTAVFVVETDIVGGTMHTVNYALEQSKLLASYKHSEKYINIKQAQGNIKLIREGKSLAISSTEDIENLKKKILNTIINKQSGSCLNTNIRTIQTSMF